MPCYAVVCRCNDVGFPVDQVHFQQGVAEELPLQDDSQDVVISTLVWVVSCGGWIRLCDGESRAAAAAVAVRMSQHQQQQSVRTGSQCWLSTGLHSSNSRMHDHMLGTAATCTKFD